MPLTFEFHPGFVVVLATGAIDVDEEIAAFHQLIETPEFVDGMSILLDNRKREPGADPSHIHRVAAEIERALREYQIPRMAIVASRAMSFGLAAMFEWIAEQQELPMEVRTFSEFENALAWIRGEKTKP